MVDFWGLGGPGGLTTHPKICGAKPRIFLKPSPYWDEPVAKPSPYWDEPVAKPRIFLNGL